eukprot:1157757-Pelagomonas_calceolata.AAC.24
MEPGNGASKETETFPTMFVLPVQARSRGSKHPSATSPGRGGSDNVTGAILKWSIFPHFFSVFRELSIFWPGLVRPQCFRSAVLVGGYSDATFP